MKYIYIYISYFNVYKYIYAFIVCGKRQYSILYDINMQNHVSISLLRQQTLRYCLCIVQQFQVPMDFLHLVPQAIALKHLKRTLYLKLDPNFHLINQHKFHQFFLIFGW